MADTIRLRAHEDDKKEEVDQSEYLNTVMPDLAFIVRDFGLELNWKGVPINEDQYLEKCLEENPGKTQAIRVIKCSLKAFFKNRKCYTVPHPEVIWKIYPGKDLRSASGML
jgi:hypothetical protein